LNDISKPLRPPNAKALIKKIMAGGSVRWGTHAEEEVKKDNLEKGDVLNVLRGGIVSESEWESGEWRYRVETPRICVVVAFRSEKILRVVTAWRKKI